MDRNAIERTLQAVRAGELSVEAAAERLSLGVEPADLGFARVDRGRCARRGFPEAIYGPGKTPEQIVAIAAALTAAGQRALVTRLTAEQADALQRLEPSIEYRPNARAALFHAERSDAASAAGSAPGSGERTVRQSGEKSGSAVDETGRPAAPTIADMTQSAG